MPGVALIFAKDGAAAAEGRVRTLAGRMAYRGTNVTTATTKNAAVAQFARDDRRSIGSSAAWHVAVDGRIDNRVELSEQLRLDHPHSSGSGDASLVAAALERWDAEAAPRLLGDFAIVALHRHTPRVLLIRDVRGLRPLYYCDRAHEFICASDLQSIVREASPRVDEGVVAEWLTGSPATHSGTLYQGVRRLPMAHLLDVSTTAILRRQYWIPTIDPSVAGLDDDQRAAAFVGLLRDCVTARTAGAERTALWLSGGLDSSTLAATMRDVAEREWRCFTLVHPASGIDERAFAEPVAASLGAELTTLASPDVTLDDITSDIRRSLDVPSPPNGLQSEAGRLAAVERGFRVALSGLGSDEWFGGSFLSYSDLARSGRYLELVQTVWADRHREESTRVRLQIAAWSLCPPWLQRTVRSALHRSLTPPWVSSRLARATCLDDRLRANDVAAPDLPLLSQRALYADNIRGGYVAGTEMQERANARCGLDERYPFHDRRMIEFSLALPESDRWSRGHYKGVIRRAMAPRLPREVIDRQDSPNANRLLAATLIHIGGRAFFERLQIADADWVDRHAVLQLWDRFAAGREPGIEVWQLWAIAAMELWWMHGASSSAAHEGEAFSVA